MPFPVIGVGASAGGLEAYLELFGCLPENTGMAFVLVQHLAPNHVSMLTEIVSKRTRMRVQEITDGMTVEPDHVYIIPPKFILEIFHGALHLRPLDEKQTTNRLVDTFLTSLANDHGTMAVGVVLSGTGSDGAIGLRTIKAEGGISLVQDPADAKFDGMPRMAIALDHPDYVLPIKGLAAELVKIAKNPRARTLLTGAPRVSAEEELILKKIYLTLREAQGTDFALYKQPTLLRRIRRRMVLQRIETLKQYFTFLQSDAAELRALFNDFLINVTSFFRDPESFEALKRSVFPALLKDRARGSPIRIWVPGCSSGEEVYSIAIALLEQQAAAGTVYPVQIYGSDVSEAMIKRARAGLFPDSISRNVSAERLASFFVKEGEDYRISRPVRDCCIFSVQDATSDPPIHRLDLLSCRNLMIYLDQPVQKRLIEIFFYALNPSGFLMLGASEAMGAATSLFSLVDKTGRIFAKRRGVGRSFNAFKAPAFKNSPTATEHSAGSGGEKHLDILQEAERSVFESCALAWILVNQALDIVHIRGSAERFLAPAAGEPSWALNKMLREELVTDARILIQRSAKSSKEVRKEGVAYKYGKSLEYVDITVVKVGKPPEQPHFLVIFRESRGEAAKALPKSKQVSALQKELQETRRSLRGLIEEQRSATEGFQSVNEEIMSANEELQSTNEELETAKEELQSTNEELTTLNEELSSRNSELAQTSSDLMNVLNNADLALVMVSPRLEIRRFTPVAGKLLHLMASDVGRRLTEINFGIQIDDLETKVADVLLAESSMEWPVTDRNGHRYSMRLRPYRTLDGRNDGAVILFLDVETLLSRST